MGRWFQIFLMNCLPNLLLCPRLGLLGYLCGHPFPPAACRLAFGCKVSPVFFPVVDWLVGLLEDLLDELGVPAAESDFGYVCHFWSRHPIAG